MLTQIVRTTQVEGITTHDSIKYICLFDAIDDFCKNVRMCKKYQSSQEISNMQLLDCSNQDPTIICELQVVGNDKINVVVPYDMLSMYFENA